jgi:hypothetical protein
MFNLKYGLFLSIIFIIIYRFSQLIKIKEGFKWDSQSRQDFLLIQNKINPHKIFDINTIQENQASQQEIKYFNKNGIWPWSEKTINLYKDAINKNTFIRTYSDDAVNYARTIYNESAILRILSYQTNEGQFLLNGVLIKNPSGNKFEEQPSGFGLFSYNSGLKENKSEDIIKCNFNNTNEATLERITFTGKGEIFGEQTSNVSQVNYNNLENIIPGFSFINGSCNPCKAINETPDYSCPFQLFVKNSSPVISDVWQYLWNVADFRT